MSRSVEVERDLKRLEESRVVERVAVSDRDVVAYWEKALRARAAAELAGMDAENAFELGYKAAFLAVTAVLAAEGLKVRGTSGHHFNTFNTLRILRLPKLSDLAAEVESHRSGRHTALYAPTSVPFGPAWEALRDILARLLPTVRAYLTNARPTLARVLPEPK